MKRENKPFLGIPVKGDIHDGHTWKNQRSLEEFSPILQSVLDDPTIVEFGWTQYTPHYNDGEPCVFRAHTPWFRTEADMEQDDLYELEIAHYGGHPSLGTKKSIYNRETYTHEQQPYEGPDEERYDRCKALSDAIENGEFYAVLMNAFGDHAEVTVKKDGIEVDFYERD